MADWYASGPLDVPLVSERSGRFIDETRLDELCEVCPELADGNGVYVFAMRSGGGTLPIYVGMTEARKLVDEIFSDRNQKNVNRYINRQTGTLVLFVITRVKTPGKPNMSNIREIETFLIGAAEGRNSDLINKRTPPDVNWSIKGVYNPGPGKPDRAAIAFKEMMGMQTERRATNGIEAAATESEESRPTVSADEGTTSIQAH
jgi:hypothetical protein